MSLIRRWFSLTAPVDRKFYAISGLGLMVLKFAVDGGLAYAATGRLWTPLDYLNPFLAARFDNAGALPEPIFIAMAIWTLPFVWVGASMSVRRAANAGLTPWVGLGFFLPICNYILMIYLALAPSRERSMSPSHSSQADAGVDDRVKSALLGVVSGALITVLMLGLSVFVLGTYGGGLFLGTPFVIGATSGWLYNRRTPRPLYQTSVVASVAIMLSGLTLLLFMLEGMICIAMAMPLALFLAILGAAIGRAIAAGGTSPAHAAVIVFALPLITAAEAPTLQAPLREVLTTREVNVPPERIWPNITSVTELPPPDERVFALGIAYPMRARIVGSGVGAVRHCEFSTGAFVEPITVWDEPRRLAFDVASQPPPMTEWSPYRHVFAPHLDGYLRSKKGEFRLVPLGSGRTRIEARTWYELEIFPIVYWSRYGDALISAIHKRVLEHVAHLSGATP